MMQCEYLDCEDYVLVSNTYDLVTYFSILKVSILSNIIKLAVSA